jgi:hypothetical protein
MVWEFLAVYHGFSVVINCVLPGFLMEDCQELPYHYKPGENSVDLHRETMIDCQELPYH